MDALVFVGNNVVHHFEYLDIEKWLHDQRFYRAVAPAFIGKKRTLTKEQYAEHYRNCDTARLKNDEAVAHYTRKALDFFGQDIRYAPKNGWTATCALLVPLCYMDAWLDDAFRGRPEPRPAFDFDMFADAVAATKKARVHQQLVELALKRTQLEAEMADIVPIKQAKRARRGH